MYGNDICMGCEHFCHNNEDGLGIGCRAYPKGIPSTDIGDGDVIEMEHSHDKVRDNQVGDYVYMPAKKEFDRLGYRIIINQEYNLFADENGRFKRFMRDLSEITIDNVTEEEMFRIRLRYENGDCDPEWKELREKMSELQEFWDNIPDKQRKFNKWFNKFLRDNQ